MLETTLNFETNETKVLLSKLDFEFFLNKNIEEQNYTSGKTQILFSAHKEKYEQLLGKNKMENKEQNLFYIEGKVRKMFNGGLLPTLFELNNVREHVIVNFSEMGINWAYFDYWKKCRQPNSVGF